MIAAEPFFGPCPRTTISAAGVRFRAIAGPDRTERSFMRFERRYPAAAELSSPYPRRSRTNSPSENSWTWIKPPPRRWTRLPRPRLPCRRMSGGAASSLMDMSGKKPPAVQGRRISLAPRRVERDGLSAGRLKARAGCCPKSPARAVLATGAKLRGDTGLLFSRRRKEILSADLTKIYAMTITSVKTICETNKIDCIDFIL